MARGSENICKIISVTHSPAACVPLFVLTTLLSHSTTELTYGNIESICEIDRLTNCKKSTYPALDFPTIRKS